MLNQDIREAAHEYRIALDKLKKDYMERLQNTEPGNRIRHYDQCLHILCTAIRVLDEEERPQGNTNV